MMFTLPRRGYGGGEGGGDVAVAHETKRDEEIRELRAQVSELQSDVELLESAAHSHGEDITELQAAHNEVVDWIEEQVSQGELTEWIEEQAAVGERSE
jgi:type II secretory pathway component PulM